LRASIHAWIPCCQALIDMVVAASSSGESASSASFFSRAVRPCLQAAARGALRDVQDAGDLVAGDALPVVELDDDLKLDLQATDRLHEQALLVVEGEQVLGVGLERGQRRLALLVDPAQVGALRPLRKKRVIV
jgi:hypothetical protein